MSDVDLSGMAYFALVFFGVLLVCAVTPPIIAAVIRTKGQALMVRVAAAIGAAIAASVAGCVGYLLWDLTVVQRFTGASDSVMFLVYAMGALVPAWLVALAIMRIGRRA